MRVGAHFSNGKTKFSLWAPYAETVEVKVVSPRAELIIMKKDQQGYWVTEADIPAGALYFYHIDHKKDLPDPASNFQPQGPHGPSQVIDHAAFPWSDSEFKPDELKDFIIYELHVGTFTLEGTFESIIEKIPHLKELGINAIELMPIAQFPGERNWGYDGVDLFAAQDSYGGPEGLKRLVDKCHQHGIAVVLDVVYNHLGPEGNYLAQFGPYFTDKYKTPWGTAVNFDDAHNDHVRNFFIQNALHWLSDYHIDALRIDAVHAIYDMSAYPFLKELSDEVKELSKNTAKPHYLIAESNLNDVKIIKSPQQGGYGLHGQWADDFHHALHTLLTGEKGGYYADYGSIDHLMKAIRESFVYSWQYSQFRKKRFGSYAGDMPPKQFVVFSQNHDQIGNRMLGERLSELVPFEGLKLAAASVILSPYIPMLFMGEEYAERAPFLYFIDHTDPDLIRAVHKGRKNEFRSFKWAEEPPDAKAEETFLKSKLDWPQLKRSTHSTMFQFYKTLIRIRKEVGFSNIRRGNIELESDNDSEIIAVTYKNDGCGLVLLLNFNKKPAVVNFEISGKGRKILDSADEQFAGPGSKMPDIIDQIRDKKMQPLSCAVFKMET